MNIGHLLAVTAMGLALSACTTTTDANNYQPTQAEVSNPYLIGYYVTYSDVCSYFNGSGAGKLQTRDVYQRYRNDPNFKRGYELNLSLIGSDIIIDLDECGKATKIVTTVYNQQK